MSDTVKKVEALHGEYVRLTGQAVSLMGREMYWWEWIRRGLTVEDLRMLVGHIKRERAAGRPVRGADMKFRNLVMDADFAEEDILALRSRMRGKVTDPGRPVTGHREHREHRERSVAEAARSVGEVAAGVVRSPDAAAKAFEEFKKWKASL